MVSGLFSRHNSNIRQSRARGSMSEFDRYYRKYPDLVMVGMAIYDDLCERERVFKHG